MQVLVSMEVLVATGRDNFLDYFIYEDVLDLNI